MIIIAFAILGISLGAYMCTLLCALAVYAESSEFEFEYINMLIWSFVPLGTAALSLIAIGVLR